MRAPTLSLALLLASGARAFFGLGVARPSLPSRNFSFRRSGISSGGRRQQHGGGSVGVSNDGNCFRAERQQWRGAPAAVRRAADYRYAAGVDTTAAAAADSPAGISLAKQALTTVALAAVLTTVSFGEGVALPPPGGAAGGGGWAPAAAVVAPAFAELEPLPLKSYSEEFSSGLAPVNTVRGLWRTRETRTDGSVLPQDGSNRLGQKGICGGRLSFKGFVGAGKGTVEYKGCGQREGKGRWLTKPKNIVNGRITLSARWSIKFADGTSLLYRGDVVQDAEAQGTALQVDLSGAAAMGGPAFERPDAHIRGEVLKPVKTIQGTLTEKKIGQFEADLIELPSDADTL